MDRWLADFLDCLRFFTRIPTGTGSHAMPEFARASRAVPLVGALVGIIVAALFAAATWATGNAMIGAIAGVAGGLLATGCFHEDGLADTADGFGGGWGIDQKLEIMKDSRLGTYGGAALFVTLALKIALVAALAGLLGIASTAAIIVAAETVSRASALHVGHYLPPVRKSGASYAAGRPSRDAFRSAWLVGGSIGLVLVWIAGSLSAALCAPAAAAAASMAVARLAVRQIGGQTGDVAGAAQQASLAAFLAAVLIVTHLSGN